MKIAAENINTIMFAPCGMNCKVCYKHCYHTKSCAGCINSDKGKPEHCRKCKIKDCIKNKSLKKEQMEERRKNRLAENYEQRVKDMDHYLNTHTNRCMEYDDKLVRRLVSQVRILTANKIQIQFQSGIVLEQGLVYE